MSVDVLCDQAAATSPAFGYIDTPSDYQFINGIFEVFGWAFDFQGVLRVEVDVDGQVVGTAAYGLSRPDVPANDSACAPSPGRVLVLARHDAASRTRRTTS